MINHQGIWLNPDGRWHAFQLLPKPKEEPGTTHEVRANTDGNTTDELIGKNWVKISVCGHRMIAEAIDDKRLFEVQVIADELHCVSLTWGSTLGTKSFIKFYGKWQTT
jgi:hypothetical protein